MLKKLCLTLGTVLGLVLLNLTLFLRNPVFVDTQDLNLASSENLKIHLNHIVDNYTPHNFKNIDNLNKTADYLLEQLISYGYSPTIQSFNTEGNEYKNIIVKIGPANTPKYIVGAHYDVAFELPGADDNTSGTVGVLELARILKGKEAELKNQVELVFYTLEEPPYFRTIHMGSYHHVQSVKHDNIKLMISVEMIGYYSDKDNSQLFPLSVLKYWFGSRGNFIAIIGKINDWWMTRKIKERFMKGTSIKTFSLNAPEKLKGIDFSDHMNYWNADIPAIMITDSAFFRNFEYHKKGDTADRLDFKKMAQVVDGIYSIIIN